MPTDIKYIIPPAAAYAAILCSAVICSAGTFSTIENINAGAEITATHAEIIAVTLYEDTLLFFRQKYSYQTYPVTNAGTRTGATAVIRFARIIPITISTLVKAEKSVFVSANLIILLY